MSAIKYNDTWRKISQIQYRQLGGWQPITAMYGRHEGDWYLIDVAAEPTGPKINVWIAYADDPYAELFEDKGVTLIPLGKEWVGFKPGNASPDPILTTNDDLEGFTWSQLGGNDAQLYYISAPDGTAIKNGVGSVSLRARLIIGGTNALLEEDNQDPQFYANGVALGKVPTPFTAADINQSLVVELREGDQVYDSITLIDVLDGSAATQVGFEATPGLAWTRDPNDGVWTPASNFSTLTFTFYRAGLEVLSREVVAELDPDTGLITATTTPITDPPEATTVNIEGNGTSTLFISCTHDDSGASYTETVVAVRGGSKGDDGEAITTEVLSDNGYFFKNNAGATKTLTAHVYLNGVLSENHDSYFYRWTTNGALVYTSSAGDFIGITPGGGLYPADPTETNGLNFRSIKVDFSDVPDGSFLNLSCEVSIL